MERPPAVPLQHVGETGVEHTQNRAAVLSHFRELQVISEVFLRTHHLRGYHRAHCLFVCQASGKKPTATASFLTYAPILVPRADCAVACRMFERTTKVRTFRRQ
jgi:hypothetical protein